MTAGEAPFVAFGRNPLAGYFLSVGADAAPCCGPEAASLIYASAYVALWAGALLVMYRKRVFIGI